MIHVKLVKISLIGLVAIATHRVNFLKNCLFKKRKTDEAETLSTRF